MSSRTAFIALEAILAVIAGGIAVFALSDAGRVRWLVGAGVVAATGVLVAVQRTRSRR